MNYIALQTCHYKEIQSQDGKASQVHDSRGLREKKWCEIPVAGVELGVHGCRWRVELHHLANAQGNLIMLFLRDS